MELFAVGKIVGCFGIDGCVKLQPTTHSVERFGRLRSVFIGRSVDSATPYRIDEVLDKNRSTMLRIHGVDDRTTAEALVGAFIFVREEDLSKPPEGSYLIHEIVGAEVVTQEGKVLGTISDVYKLPGQDMWVVRRGEKEYLLPVVKEFIASVDVARKRITVCPIEGLFDE